MDLGLTDKVAVVTGGSVGIGLGVARAFAREGAHVLIAARDRDRAEAPPPAIAGDVRRHRAPRTPATSPPPTGCASLVEAAAAAGGADILVNNAGTGSNETILEAPDDKWQAYWDLHVMAAVRLARGLVPLMERPRRRRDPEQRLDLRGAAALVRADLQRDQVGADDAVEDHGDRVHPEEHPGELHQPRPDPHAGLGQDREAALRRRLGGLPAVGRRRARADQALRHRRGAGRLLRLPLLRRAPATRSAPPTSSTAACSAQSEEISDGRCPVARALPKLPRARRPARPTPAPTSRPASCTSASATSTAPTCRSISTG